MPLQPRKTAILRFIYSRTDDSTALPMDIERRYDVSLTIDRETVAAHRFSSPFGDERWREIVEAIRECASERYAAVIDDESPESAARRRNRHRAEDVRGAGMQLYRALGDLSPALRRFVEETSPRRLVVESRRPEIHALPWEALTNEAFHSLAASDLSIVRCLDAFDLEPRLSPGLLDVIVVRGPGVPDSIRPLADVGVTNEAGRETGVRMLASDSSRAQLVHLVAHGDPYEGTIDVSVDRRLLPAQLADHYQNRLMVLLWSCYSSKNATTNPSVAMALQSARNMFVLGFVAPLNFSAAEDIARQFYGDVFGSAGHQDPERAVTAIRGRLFGGSGDTREDGKFEFCDWASMTLWLQAPIDLSGLPLGRVRVPEENWSDASAAAVDVRVRKAFETVALGDVRLVEGARPGVPLPKELVRDWSGPAVHLHGANALDDAQLFESLGLKLPPAALHRADRLLRLIDHLSAYRHALLVWTAIGGPEVLLFETLDGLPPNLAVLLISPHGMRLRWHARITAEPFGSEAPIEESLPDEPEARVLCLARREQFREALEVAQGVNSDDPEFWSVLYVASVKVDGPNSERTDAFIDQLRRVDPIEALLQEGNRLTRQERHRLAREKYQQAAQGAQAAGRRRELARIRQELAYVAHDMGDRGLARQLYLSAIALLDDTPVTERNSLWTSALARALRDYAQLLAKSGSADALPLLRRAAAVHALEGRLTQVAYCYVTRSEFMCRVGRYDDADASAQWAAIVFDAAGNIDGWVEAVRLVARAAAAQNRQDQALGVLRHAAARPLRGGLIGKLLLQMAEVSWATGRVEDAAAHARRAIAVLPAEHHHERADARRIAEVSATLLPSPRRVAALAGRMFDGKPDSTSTLAARVRRSFIEERIEVLVCSAARGADLLALDVAGGLGIRRVVVLPFSIDRFRQTSVAGGDEGWQRLYKRIIEEVQEVGDLIINAPSGAAYHDTNERILVEARGRASSGQRPLAFVVWEGQSRDAKDVTGGFRHAAEKDFDIRDLLL